MCQIKKIVIAGIKCSDEIKLLTMKIEFLCTEWLIMQKLIIIQFLINNSNNDNLILEKKIGKTCLFSF